MILTVQFSRQVHASFISIIQRKDPQDGLMQSYPIRFTKIAELESGYVKVPPRIKGQLNYPNQASGLMHESCPCIGGSTRIRPMRVTRTSVANTCIASGELSDG